MADLIKQIEFTVLPKCFQDAVTATKRLGGEYLWIDSLCIIQDSPEDWATESGLMHHTYSNGICNLAASNQSSWNPGLFCTRDPAMGAPLTVDCFWADKDRAEKTSVYPNMFHVVKEHAPLYKRGWVTQEQRLSPRTIHMAAFPTWECRQAVLSETLPSQDICAEYGWQCAPDKLHLESFGGHPETYWLETIEDYSLCGLTKDSDKLVALGGVAKTLSQRLGNQYFAGIWGGTVKTFIRGLLWHCQVYLDGMPRETGRYEEYVAPSWSWASVNGPILAFKEPVSVPLIDILAATVYPRNDDIFGQLHAGYIKAHGVLFPFPSINSIKGDWDSYSIDVSFDPLDLNLDDRDWRQYGHNETWFLPLALTPKTAGPASFDACGILLQQTDASKAAYHRVGYVVVSHDGEVANSGWFIGGWRPPPWTRESYSIVTIV